MTTSSVAASAALATQARPAFLEMAVMHSLARKIPRKAAYELACLVAACVAGGRVAAGPFAGMRYRRSKRATYPPKILGTYELEIADVIERLCAHAFPKIVNVGAAEGYYAVGFARRCPHASVVAFEAKNTLRRDLVRLAADNSVADRLDIHGWCRPADLRGVLAGLDDVLLMVDVEGAESELLNPAAVPNLSQAHIVVELHDFIVPGVSPLVRRRFERTHVITEVRSRPRSADDLAVHHGSRCRTVCPRRLIEVALEEGRPCEMAWFFLEPRGLGLDRPATAVKASDL